MHEQTAGLVGGAWYPFGTLITPGAYGMPSVALTGGQIFVFGGATGPSFVSAEQYWIEPGATAGDRVRANIPGRARHALLALPDGGVLLSGGTNIADGTGSDPRFKDVYALIRDGGWSSQCPHPHARAFHALVPLPDGGNIAIGGVDETFASRNTTDLGECDAGIRVTGPSMAISRAAFANAVLPDGRILVSGGRTNAALLVDSIEELSGSWTDAGTMSEGRSHHTLTVLRDGGVLFIGGFSGTVTDGGLRGTPTASVDFYDPKTRTVTSIAPLPEARAEHGAAVFPSGRVFVFGGVGAGYALLPTDALFDPTSGVWIQTYGLGLITQEGSRTDFAYGQFTNGQLLAVGGRNSSGAMSSVEVFQLPDGEPCTGPVQCSSARCVDGVCCDTTCEGGCVACVSSRTGKRDGECAPVLRSSPAAAPFCPAQVQGCGYTGTCDGDGGCTFAGPDRDCGTTCVGPNLHRARCDGTGACIRTESSCSEGMVCSFSQCVPAPPDGGVSEKAPAEEPEPAVKPGCGCSTPGQQWLLVVLLLLRLAAGQFRERS